MVSGSFALHTIAPVVATGPELKFTVSGYLLVSFLYLSPILLQDSSFKFPGTGQGRTSYM